MTADASTADSNDRREALLVRGVAQRHDADAQRRLRARQAT